MSCRTCAWWFKLAKAKVTNVAVRFGSVAVLKQRFRFMRFGSRLLNEISETLNKTSARTPIPDGVAAYFYYRRLLLVYCYLRLPLLTGVCFSSTPHPNPKP